MIGIPDLNTIPIAQMTCEEFYETKEDWFTEMIQEQFWDGGVNTNALFESLLEMAKSERVLLTDVDTFEADTFFYNCYRSTEKGLS